MSYTVKPKVGHIKVKNSAQVLMHVENISNDVYNQIIQHFPNYQALKYDVEFIESILKTVIDALKASGSKADEKTIVVNIFVRLFQLKDSEKVTLTSIIDYLLSNKVVTAKSSLGRAYSSFKKVLSSSLQSKN
jgi:methionine synthase II (cobalamin-independent)